VFAPEAFSGRIMSDVTFTYVAPGMLSFFEGFETPLAVFSFGTGNLVWANASALAHWSAQSFGELARRADSAGNPAVASLLDDALPALRRGEPWQQPCPLRPEAAAISCTGISLDGHPEALLAEIRPAAAASDAGTDGLLEHIAAPALVMSADGARLLKANAAARQLLQAATADTSPVTGLFVKEDERATFFEEVVHRGKSIGSAQLVGQGGRHFAAAVAGNRFQIGTTDAVLLVIHDIDVLHRALRELETALGFQRTVSHKQRRMLEIASHEFRTPLAVIDGAAQRIARFAANGAPEQVAALTDRIRETVERLGRLIENTVERARDNRVGMECRTAPGLLQNVIAQAAMNFGENADIEIADSIADLPEIQFDRTLIGQVFVNLIENAIKYSAGRARVHFSAVAGPDEVEILVRDWGIGILPEERERVFAESARGTNVGPRTGSGLGLFIVRQIIRAHEGEVSVVETDGPGTTLKVVLPIRQASERMAERGAARG
jgi:signal transduction histidine kinase